MEAYLQILQEGLGLLHRGMRDRRIASDPRGHRFLDIRAHIVRYSLNYLEIVVSFVTNTDDKGGYSYEPSI